MNLVRRSSDAVTRASKLPVHLDPFEGIFDDGPFGFLFDSFSRDRRQWPAVDVFDKEGDFFIRAEIPGMAQQDIDVKLSGNVLILSGEKKAPEDDENLSCSECWYGSFSRSFTLPDTVDRDGIRAEYKNGVLTVRVPRTAEAKPRAIPISVN